MNIRDTIAAYRASVESMQLDQAKKAQQTEEQAEKVVDLINANAVKKDNETIVLHEDIIPDVVTHALTDVAFQRPAPTVELAGDDSVVRVAAEQYFRAIGLQCV